MFDLAMHQHSELSLLAMDLAARQCYGLQMLRELIPKVTLVPKDLCQSAGALVLQVINECTRLHQLLRVQTTDERVSKMVSKNYHTPDY